MQLTDIFGNRNSLLSTVLIKDDFSGSQIDATKWNAIADSGHSISVQESTLRINTGTNPSTQTKITSKSTFGFPMRLGFVLALSQIGYSQKIIIGISDDSGNNAVSLIFSNSVSPKLTLYSSNNGFSTSKEIPISLNLFPVPLIYTIDCFYDEIRFSFQSSSGSDGDDFVIFQKIPDINQNYSLAIQAINGALALDLSADIRIDSIYVAQYSQNSSPSLPTGAATDNTLRQLRDRLPSSLGQLGKNASFPVVLPLDQVVPVSLASLPSLPPGSNVIGAFSNTSFNIGNFPSTQAISVGFGNSLSIVDPTASSNKLGINSNGYLGSYLVDGTANNKANINSSGQLAVNVANSSLAATQSGTWNVGLSAGINAIGSITNTSFSVTGTLPSFATIPTFKIDQTTPGTTNKVNIGNDGTVAISGSVAVTGTFYQATQPVSLASLPSLPTGSNVIGAFSNTSFNVGNFPSTQAISVGFGNSLSIVDPTTSSNKLGINSNGYLGSYLVDGTANNKANINSSGQLAVNVANSSLAATQSGTWNINNISGTIALPTGAALDSSVTAISALLMPDASSYENVAANATANIKNAAGRVYAVTVTNLNTSAIRYLQLFDALTATGTPKRVYPLPANGGTLIVGQETFGGKGLSFSTGISFGFSTTATTYTAGSASDCILAVRYL